MGKEDRIKTIAYNTINKQLALGLPPEISEGKIHKDFIILHPRGQYPVCGHLTRNDVSKEAGHFYCMLNAGWGTDHVGVGFCRIHGGKGAPKTQSGRYSKYIKTQNLVKKHEEFMFDPQLLDLREEIAVLRSILVEILEVKESSQEIAQKKDIKIEAKLSAERTYNRSLGKIENIIEKIARIVETKNRIENGEKHTIKIEVLHLVIVQVIGTIKKYISDPEILKHIGHDLQNLNLTEGY